MSLPFFNNKNWLPIPYRVLFKYNLITLKAIKFSQPTYLSQGVSSHGKPGKAMEFHICFPGLEKSWKLTPGFGKFIKGHGNFKRHPLVKRRCSFFSSSISIQGYVYVIRSNFGVSHIFLYCDWNLVYGSQRQKKSYKYGLLHLPSWPWYMSRSM